MALSRPHRTYRVLLLLLAAVVATGVSSAPAQAGNRVRPDFFGIDIAIGPQGVAAWPGFDPGVVRIAQAWRSAERSPGVYDWTHLDVKVSTAEAHGATPLIVIEGAPSFHAIGAGAPNYGSPPALPAYRSWVQALVARYGARVDYQVWNEANVPIFFTGTPAHMAAMTKILGQTARKLAPTATVVAPSFPLRGEGSAFRGWFRAYWSQKIGKRPVGRFVDAASLSAYPMPDEDPEDGLELTQWARHVLHKKGFDGPLWATEINYGANGLAPTPAIPMKRQVSYVVRTYVLHTSAGADRVYWWRWEPHQTVNTRLNNGKGGLTRAGRAFGEVKDWLVGTAPKGCEVRKGLTTCKFRVRKGVHRYVSWTRAVRARTLHAPAGARTLTKPSGRTSSLKPGKGLRVGITPIMIETRKARRSGRTHGQD